MRFRAAFRRAARRFAPSLAAPPRCASCGRTNSSAVRLIAGPGFYLCVSCVTSDRARVPYSDRIVTFVRCRWCRARRLESQIQLLCGIPTCDCCRGVLAAVAGLADSEKELDT